MDFSVQDNWGDVGNLRGCRIPWRKIIDNPNHIVYESTIGARKMAIRMNDFPDEPLYTLIANGVEIIHFNDWPDKWIREC